jgi:hypothetical protein
VYKKKLLAVQAWERQESLPLDEEIIKLVNHLLGSKHCYKCMTSANVAEAALKAVFNSNSITSYSKKWIQNNIFTPKQVLKQMDLHGGTLIGLCFVVQMKFPIPDFPGLSSEFRIFEISPEI